MMNEDSFARLVAEDVKNRVTDEQRKYLRLYENRSRWREHILVLLANLEDQVVEIDEHQEDDKERYGSFGDEGIKLLAEAQASADDRKKKVLRFRFHVENRLDECDRLDAIESDEPSEFAASADFMRRAIEKHKEMTFDADYDPTEIDRALWFSLAGEWKFDEIDIDLA
jgi:hypothetical protein